jgi:hypothetical protein
MSLTIVSGALAGLLHVVSGPDHLSAVAPLAASDRRRGWLAGWTWGIGHSAGVVTVALLALVLSHWSERLVGGALVAVGAWALRKSASIRPAAHRHGSMAHGHVHVRRGPGWLRRLGHAHASFYLGILHGIAGSSHFFGVLPALALPSRLAGLTYITAFGAGTVGAMTGFAALVGLAGARFGPHTMPHRLLMFVSSVAALVTGCVWLLA